MRPSKGLEACVDVVFIFCQSASPSALFAPPCLCIFSAVFFCSFIIHLRLPSLSARPPRLATKSLNPLLRGVYQPCAVTQSSDRKSVSSPQSNRKSCAPDRSPRCVCPYLSHSRTRENRYTFFLPHFRDYLKKGSC